MALAPNSPDKAGSANDSDDSLEDIKPISMGRAISVLNTKKEQTAFKNIIRQRKMSGDYDNDWLLRHRKWRTWQKKETEN